eukprot:gene28177-37079_t
MEKENSTFSFAYCAEGIYASEAEVVRNCNGDNSANLEIKLKITDDAILISHEGPTSCSREFTTLTKPRNISRSILTVSSGGDYVDPECNLFEQLVVAMENNMEMNPAVDDAIFGALASTDLMLLAVIDKDSTSDKFRIRHTNIVPFRQQGNISSNSDIQVFDADFSKLLMEYYFSMVMNDGKQREINYSAMQTSIDAFRSQCTTNELIRKEGLMQRQELAREREEARVREQDLERQLQEREEELVGVRRERKDLSSTKCGRESYSVKSTKRSRPKSVKSSYSFKSAKRSGPERVKSAKKSRPESAKTEIEEEREEYREKQLAQNSKRLEAAK